MPVRRTRRATGSGITQRTVETIAVNDPENAEDHEAIRELLAGSRVTIKGEGGEAFTVALRHSFGPDASVIEERARAVLSQARNGKYPPDSPEGYAVRELELVRLVRSHIRAGDADAAAHDALKLGALLMQEDMKLAHEPSATTGAKQRRHLADTSERWNQEVRVKAEKEWSRWQTEADAAWGDDPRLSKNAVARIVKSKLNLTESIGAIARRLKKPRQAG